MAELKKMNIEQMLTMAAESSQLSGWDDALSRLAHNTILEYESKALSEDMLEFVAGGIKIPEQQKNEKSRKE